MKLMNNRILLVAVNSRFTHSNLALRYLRQYAADLDYVIEIREFTVQQAPADIAASLVSEDPGALAFSVYIWNALAVREIIARVRKMSPRCIIILGGPEAGYNAGEWLENGNADFVVTGPGEQGFRDLLERGLAWDGPVMSSPNPRFSQIPMPYIESDFSSLAHRYVYYESSRGCPFRCAYCLSSRSDQELEVRDTNLVKEELDFIARHRPHTVKFVDRSFNATGEHCREIWRHCIGSYGSAGIQFHFELHPSLMKEENFLVLEKAPPGLFRFEIGLQSANADSLREVGRVQDWDGAGEAVARLVSMKKFHVHADLIAGLPYEDMPSMERSFNGAYGLGADYLQLGFLKVLPGTAVSRRAGYYGLEYDLRPPYRVMKTLWLSETELIRLDKMAHLVNSIHNTGNFPVTLKELALAHHSPFELFRRMSLHAGGTGEGPPDRDWIRCARFILSFVEAELKEYLAFITDCLRWDWCGARAPRLYPPFLRREGDDRFRQDAMRRGEEPLSRRHGFVFIPETERFRQKYCPGEEGVIFPRE